MALLTGYGYAVIGLLLVGFCIYRYIIHPTFLSPLSRIPSAHPFANVTDLWILWVRYQSREIQTIHAAHERLGPVIRLAPKEISVNCVKGGIQTIYSGGFEKGDWYDLFANYGGVRNMFSDPIGKSHSARKRMLSNIYSKSYLQSSPTIAAVTKTLIYKRFIPRLDVMAKSSTPFNIYAEFSAITMDFVTGYQFGLAASSNLVQDEEHRRHFLELYDSRRSFNFWPQEAPGLTSFLAGIGVQLVPKWVGDANKEIEDWALSMCDTAASFLARTHATRVEDVAADDVINFPVVYSQMQLAIAKGQKNGQTQDSQPERLEMASEMLDHLAAGFDTSGITLTYVIHELSQRPELQVALRKELLSLDPPLSLGQIQEKTEWLPSAKSLDALPLLDAIVQETLRVRSAIPGPEPRITPLGGCSLGLEGEYAKIPGGVRISAQAHSLHRNPEVYERPNEWDPHRWLQASDDKMKEMRRWFWAFGSGGRMCVGSNLALYQMKFIIAAIYTNFTSTIIDDDEIEQVDLYTAPPKGGKLLIKLDYAGG